LERKWDEHGTEMERKRYQNYEKGTFIMERKWNENVTKTMKKALYITGLLHAFWHLWVKFGFMELQIELILELLHRNAPDFLMQAPPRTQDARNLDFRAFL
jgi:hypothetical protein